MIYEPDGVCVTDDQVSFSHGVDSSNLDNTDGRKKPENCYNWVSLEEETRSRVVQAPVRLYECGDERPIEPIALHSWKFQEESYIGAGGNHSYHKTDIVHPDCSEPQAEVCVCGVSLVRRIESLASSPVRSSYRRHVHPFNGANLRLWYCKSAHLIVTARIRPLVTATKESLEGDVATRTLTLAPDTQHDAVFISSLPHKTYFLEVLPYTTIAT
ncbi:hypothetical protein BDV96DRAFT_286889 [Lophiotrema nucula]|uniref:Uncharacterized protein n=1 Tax=Lophiotrema nucula TaxID=690887 RepID=A0A6A5YLP0_9PLEO|nr:hypothetical protein BDV96DRAFT_286889 [Lophiotrema nucula]